MSSLATCIKRAGKALSADDAAAIRQIHDDYVAAGEQNAAQMAVDDYLEILAAERADIVAQVEAQGGVVPATEGIALRDPNPLKKVARAIASTKLLSGTETLTIKGDRNWENLAAALVARTKKANRGRTLDAMTPRNREILSEAIAIETVNAMRKSGHAGNWYSDVLESAVRLVGLIHPEVHDSVEQRAAFMLGLAITSNGLDVNTNSNAAEEVYQHFKENGRFPEWGYGDKAPAMTDAFMKANELIDRWGLDDFVQFLNTEFTVGELNVLGFNVSGESVDHQTWGSIIFGPKIGGGFYQNLMGNYAPLTMDRWWMRTWGRLTGTLIPDRTSLPEIQKERFLAEIENSPADVERLGFSVSEVVENDAKLLELARAVHRDYANTGFKAKTAFNKTGKNLDLAATAPVIAPGGARQRAWMREVVGAALDKLKQRRHDVNAASLQALVWYPEKELALKYGVGNARSAPTDYEQEFAKIAAEKGVDERRIAAARSSEQNERPAGDVGAARDGEPAEPAEAAPRLSKQERTRLLHKAATQQIREQLPGAYRDVVPKGPQRELMGAPVALRVKPQVRFKNVYGKAGLATPEWNMLAWDPQSAKLFHEKISAARDANASGAAVYVYPEAEYADMRLYLTDDGLAGFALHGDDIVSVFKHPDSNEKGVAQSAIALAVQHGGRRLDAFDTVLPSIYSMQGFRVAARVAWDDSQAPANWQKDAFSAFNNGEPDVVFMVYDKDHFNAYTGQNEGAMVEYDDAVRMQREEVASLAERNNPPDLMLALRQDPDAVERVTRDPASPLARLHKLGATMEDQSNHNPGQVRDVVSAINEFRQAGGVRKLLSIIPRRNLADFLPDEHAPALRAYIREANRMSGSRNELLGAFETLGHRWAKYNRSNKRMAGRMADLMHAATLAGVDPSKRYRSLKKPEKMTAADKREDALRREQYVALKKFYGQLDEEAQGIFNDVRDAYLLQRNAVEQALEQRIEDSAADEKSRRAMLDLLRKKFEAGRVRGPYFPLARFGDLWASAKDAEGNVVSYSRFENREDQRAWLKEWKDQGYAVDKGRKMEDSAILNRVDPEFVRKVQDLVAEPSLRDEIWQMYMRTLPEMSMRKQFMHRKGRMGFSADALRAFGATMFHGAHQLSKLKHMYKMENHLADLREQVRAIEQNDELEREFNWAAPVYDEMRKRHEAAMAPKASPWAVRTTAFGFAWYLGITPAAAAVNLSQTPLVAFPVLAARFNAMGAMKELANAAKLYAGSRGNYENRLRGEEYDAVREARRIGLFEKTQAHDLAGVAEEGANAYGGAIQRGMEVASFLFHKAEQFNREVTFLAGYRLARQAGRSHPDAILEAEDMVWDSHFDYNNDNRPVFMQQDLWRVLTLFKQYSLNMTYRMARDFNDSIRGYTKEQKVEARKRFAGMMGMAFLMAGYTGLPTAMTAPVAWVMETIFGDEDEPFDFEDAMRAYLADIFGYKMAEGIMKGPVDAMTGLTLSNRVSLGQLWMRDPGVHDKGDELFMHYFMEIAGPIPATVRDVFFTGTQLLEEGYTYKGIEKMVPKFARDILRAQRYATEGATTMHTPPDVLVAAEEFSPLDIFWQTFGFSPARLTMQYEQNNALREAEAHILQRRQHLLDMYQLAVFSKDKQGAKAAMEKIGKFNRTNPMIAIKGDALQQGSMSRLERSARAIGGVTLNKNLVYLYRDMLFTPNERIKPEEEE